MCHQLLLKGSGPKMQFAIELTQVIKWLWLFWSKWLSKFKEFLTDSPRLGRSVDRMSMTCSLWKRHESIAQCKWNACVPCFFPLFHGLEESVTSFAIVLSPGIANKWNKKTFQFVIRLLFHLQLVVLIGHNEDCKLNHSKCNHCFPKKCCHSYGLPIEWNCAAFHCNLLVC